MHASVEMSAFSPVMKCPGDETSSALEDDGTPISVAVRFRPDHGDKNVRLSRLILDVLIFFQQHRCAEFSVFKLLRSSSKM